MRLNLLCGAASVVIVALGYGDPTGVAVSLALALVLVGSAIVVGPAHRRTPAVITRMPTDYERHSGSKWIPGFTIRIPFIPFLSIGFFRWRGRK